MHGSNYLWLKPLAMRPSLRKSCHFFRHPLVHTHFSPVSIAIHPECWHWNYTVVSFKHQTWFLLAGMPGWSWRSENDNHWLWRVWEGSKVWTNSLLGNKCPSMSLLESVDPHVRTDVLCAWAVLLLMSACTWKTRLHWGFQRAFTRQWMISLQGASTYACWSLQPL